MDLAAAKMIGAGLACSALIGAGIGIGTVFAALNLDDIGPRGLPLAAAAK